MSDSTNKRKIADYFGSVVKDNISNYFKEKTEMTTNGQCSVQLRWRDINHWMEENTDGPNNTRLSRFRRTKEQMQRGLTRDQAFTEYNHKVSGAVPPVFDTDN